MISVRNRVLVVWSKKKTDRWAHLKSIYHLFIQFQWERAFATGIESDNTALFLWIICITLLHPNPSEIYPWKSPIAGKMKADRHYRTCLEAQEGTKITRIVDSRPLVLYQEHNNYQTGFDQDVHVPLYRSDIQWMLKTKYK